MLSQDLKNNEINMETRMMCWTFLMGIVCVVNAFEFYHENMPKKISAGQWIFKDNVVNRKSDVDYRVLTTTSTTTTTTTTTTATTTTSATTTTTTTSATSPASSSSESLNEPSSLRLVDPGLDARREIATYNSFMDAIFDRMNAALRAKKLDPMTLRVVQKSDESSKPELDRPDDINRDNSRNGDVSIFISDKYRTVRCPFSLGPLRLKVARRRGEEEKETKSATAATELMLGLMDLRVDVATGQVEVTDVVFDEPGSVDVTGGLRKRASNMKVGNKSSSEQSSPYKLVLASETSANIEKMARLVMQPSPEATL